MAAALSWRDALDVLLVALVIYRIFTLFRGTRAMQMLVGVGVLVVASFGARQLELHSLSWLLDTLWSFWVVVLVVLFQPELRRALTSLGHAAALRHVLGGGVPPADAARPVLLGRVLAVVDQDVRVVGEPEPRYPMPRIRCEIGPERGLVIGEVREHLPIGFDAVPDRGAGVDDRRRGEPRSRGTACPTPTPHRARCARASAGP